jgi:hypothetical protein
MNDMRQIAQNHSRPTRDADFHATPDASSQGQRPSVEQLRRKHLRRKRVVTLELMLSVMLSAVAIGLVHSIERQDQQVTIRPDTLLVRPAQVWPPNTTATYAEDRHLDGVHLLVGQEVAADTMRNLVPDSSTTSNSPRESLTDQEPGRNVPSSARWNHEPLIGPDINGVAEQRMVVATNLSILQMTAVSLTAIAFALLGIGVRLAVHDTRRSC